MPRKRIPDHPGATPVKRDGRTVGYRAQIIDPVTQKKLSANKLLRLKGALYETKAAASEICWEAEKLIGKTGDRNVTVAQLRERWLNRGWDYKAPGTGHWKKESSRIIAEQRTAVFCKRYADIPVPLVTDDIADEYWNECTSQSHIDSLKVMFNWAMSREGGRLCQTNPFEGFRTTKGSNAQKLPPSIVQVDAMIEAAYDILPAFGAWLEFACYTGARPGEIDLLKWSDLDDGWLEATIERQFNAQSKTETLPKNGRTRQIRVFERARRALQMAKATCGDSPYVFTNTRGDHFRPVSRIYTWNKVRERAGLAQKEESGRYAWSLYLCTRHFTGWYMVNALEIDSEDVAIQLGHTDGGQLVRTLYGHREHKRARDRLGAADAMYQSTQVEIIELAEAA